MPPHINHNDIEKKEFNIAKFIFSCTVHLQYTSTQSFLHVLCGSCSIIMLYLNQLFASARIDLDNSILVKLQDDSSMRDVATDVANELQVTQNYVAQIRKKRLFDF